MRKAILYRYSLPMDSGVILRDQRVTHREGVVVALGVNNKTALGEIAPLAGFSTETLSNAIEQTKEILSHWIQDKKINLESLYPSVAFGLSVALDELEDKLPTGGNYQVAPLCNGDPDELIDKLASMQGQKVAKIKVGMYEAIRDGMVVNMLLEAITDLTLRLDANQQWTLDKALKFDSYIKPDFRARIDFIEEPCQSMHESLSFAKQTGIAIAWDETSRLKGFDLQAQAKEGVSAIIVKPSLVGSVDKVSALIKEVQGVGLQAVISSSLESSLGLHHLARLANDLTPKVTPGLDTVDFFTEQLEIPWPNCNLPIRALTECEVIWQS